MEKTNPVLKRTIKELEDISREKDVDIWKDVAERLRASERNKNPVNIAKIDRNCDEGDTVVVPGKVTGYGSIDKNVKVAAFSFSKTAKSKLDENGEYMSIEDLMDQNPDGENVVIMEG